MEDTLNMDLYTTTSTEIDCSSVWVTYYRGIIFVDEPPLLLSHDIHLVVLEASPLAEALEHSFRIVAERAVLSREERNASGMLQQSQCGVHRIYGNRRIF